MGDVLPFIGTEAVASGVVTPYQLRTRYQAVYRNVYLPRGIVLTPLTKAVAAWLWSRRQSTLAGMSASAMFGSRWIDPRLPAELNRPARDTTTGIVVRSDELWDDEVTVVGDVPVTTPARTAYDIGRCGALLSAVTRIEALMRASELKVPDIESLLDRHRGARGIVQLRTALSMCDAGAESPPETRTRLLLIEAGLPRPSTQIEVFDSAGHFIARLDMGYREWRVAVEYDGAQHWTDPLQRTRDIDRLAELEAMGWRVVRVSADMLRQRPGTVVARTVAALQSAGWHRRLAF